MAGSNLTFRLKSWPSRAVASLVAMSMTAVLASAVHAEIIPADKAGAANALASIKAKSFKKVAPVNPAPTATYKYDLLGRYNEIHYASGEKVLFKRDLIGKITEVTYPDGTILTYTYYADGRVLETVKAVGE